MSNPIPRWDLSNVYPSLESPEFEAAIQQALAQIDEMEKFFAEKIGKTDLPHPETAALMGECVERSNRISDLVGTIMPYIQSFVTTDSRNMLAMKKCRRCKKIWYAPTSSRCSFRPG